MLSAKTVLKMVCTVTEVVPLEVTAARLRLVDAEIWEGIASKDDCKEL